MKQIFSTMEDLVAQGVIKDYALGGSVGFMVWTQPFLTDDTDVFVVRPEQATQHGFALDHEHIVIAGEPLQIVPSPSRLYDEAIATAVTKDLDGQAVKVMRPEHLICTALVAGRLKDFAKIEKLLDEAVVDEAMLKDLLARFDLTAVWRRYCSATGQQDPRWLHLAQTKAAWRRQQAQESLENKIMTLQKLRRKAAQFMRERCAATIDDFDGPQGWTFATEQWDVLEGPTLYSWEGPEAAGPAGVEITGTANKMIDGVAVAIRVRAEYSLETEEGDDALALKLENLKVLSATPANLTVPYDADTSFDVTDLAELLFETDWNVDDEIWRELEQRSRGFAATRRRLQNRWHTYY